MKDAVFKPSHSLNPKAFRSNPEAQSFPTSTRRRNHQSQSDGNVPSRVRMTLSDANSRMFPGLKPVRPEGSSGFRQAFGQYRWTLIPLSAGRTPGISRWPEKLSQSSDDQPLVIALQGAADIIEVDTESHSRASRLSKAGSMGETARNSTQFHLFLRFLP